LQKYFFTKKSFPHGSDRRLPPLHSDTNLSSLEIYSTPTQLDSFRLSI
jgi:hypothetical protein